MRSGQRAIITGFACIHGDELDTHVCAHREQDSPFQQRAPCWGSWLLGNVVKDLSWAVRQQPQKAVVHSEPGLSRNQV